MPFEDLDWRIGIRKKEFSDRVIVQAIGFGLQPMHLLDQGGNISQRLKPTDSGGEGVGGPEQEGAGFQEIDAWLRDPIESQHGGDLIHGIEHVIDNAGQGNNVLSLYRCDEGAIEQDKNGAGRLITLVLDLVDQARLLLGVIAVTQHGEKRGNAGLARREITAKEFIEAALLRDQTEPHTCISFRTAVGPAPVSWRGAPIPIIADYVLWANPHSPTVHTLKGRSALAWKPIHKHRHNVRSRRFLIRCNTVYLDENGCQLTDHADIATLCAIRVSVYMEEHRRNEDG